MPWGILLLVLIAGGLGLLAGRFPWLFLLGVLPIPIAWIYYRNNYKGPGDDVTGVFADIFVVVTIGAFFAGAVVSWTARGVMRWARSADDRDLQ